MMPVRFLNEHRPALAFQEHLETLDRLSRAGKIRGTKDPRSLIYMSMSGVEHQPDLPVKPPPWVLRGLAFIGRRLGYTLNDGTPHGRVAQLAVPVPPERGVVAGVDSMTWRFSGALPVSLAVCEAANTW